VPQGIPPSRDLKILRLKTALLFCAATVSLILFVFLFRAENTNINRDLLENTPPEFTNYPEAFEAAERLVREQLNFLGVTETAAWKTIAEQNNGNRYLYIGHVEGKTEWSTRQKYLYRIVVTKQEDGHWIAVELTLNRTE